MKREERSEETDLPPTKRMKTEQLNFAIINSYNVWEVRGSKPQPLKYYTPQEGDECYFIKAAYQTLIKRTESDEWDNEFIRLYLTESIEQFEKHNIQDLELCRVESIDYEIRQPRADVILTLHKIHLHVPRLGVTFWINYVGSPICQTKRFLILKELFEYSRNKFLQDSGEDGLLSVGKRVTVFFNEYFDSAKGEDGIYGGDLQKIEFGYNGLTILWDDAGEDESEKYRSVWDVMEIGEEEFTKQFHDRQFLYDTMETLPEDVPEFIEMRKSYRSAAKKIQKFMFSSQLFNYIQNDPYPVYISTIRDRCMNFYYRHHEALIKDLRHVASCGRKQANRGDLGDVIGLTCNKIDKLVQGVKQLFHKSSWKAPRKVKTSSRGGRPVAQPSFASLGLSSSSEEEEKKPFGLRRGSVPKKKDQDFVFDDDDHDSEDSDDDDKSLKVRPPPRSRKRKKAPPKKKKGRAKSKKKKKPPKKPKKRNKKKKEDPDGDYGARDEDEDDDEDDLEPLEPEEKAIVAPKIKKKGRRLMRPPKKKRGGAVGGRRGRKRKVKVDPKKAQLRKMFGNIVEEDEDYVPPRSVRRLYQDDVKKEKKKKETKKKKKKQKEDDVSDFSKLAEMSEDDLDTIFLNNQKMRYEEDE